MEEKPPQDQVGGNRVNHTRHLIHPRQTYTVEEMEAVEVVVRMVKNTVEQVQRVRRELSSSKKGHFRKGDKNGICVYKR